MFLPYLYLTGPYRRKRTEEQTRELWARFRIFHAINSIRQWFGTSVENRTFRLESMKFVMLVLKDITINLKIGVLLSDLDGSTIVETEEVRGRG